MEKGSPKRWYTSAPQHSVTETLVHRPTTTRHHPRLETVFEPEEPYHPLRVRRPLNIRSTVCISFPESCTPPWKRIRYGTVRYGTAGIHLTENTDFRVCILAPFLLQNTTHYWRMLFFSQIVQQSGARAQRHSISDFTRNPSPTAQENWRE
jgi:hypothetical protein